MSRFEWGRNIGRAKLAAGKTTQLYKSAQELRLCLDQRRFWAECVRLQYPDLNPALAPESPDSHCFEKFKRAFSFDYCECTQTWILSFVDPNPAPQTPSGGDASGDQTPPNTTPPKRGPTGGEAAGDTARALRVLAEQRIAEAAGALRSTILHISERSQTVLKSLRARWRAERQRLQIRREAVEAAISAYLRQRFLAEAQQQSFAHAELETRVISLSGGFILKLNTYVPERPRWEDWLFGRLEEDLVLIDCSA